MQIEVKEMFVVDGEAFHTYEEAVVARTALEAKAFEVELVDYLNRADIYWRENVEPQEVINELLKHYDIVRKKP